MLSLFYNEEVIFRPWRQEKFMKFDYLHLVVYLAWVIIVVHPRFHWIVSKLEGQATLGICTAKTSLHKTFSWA